MRNATRTNVIKMGYFSADVFSSSVLPHGHHWNYDKRIKNGFAWNTAKNTHVFNLGKTLEIDYITDCKSRLTEQAVYYFSLRPFPVGSILLRVVVMKQTDVNNKSYTKVQCKLIVEEYWRSFSISSSSCAISSISNRFGKWEKKHYFVHHKL